MKIVFISNFLTEHQLPFSLEMAERLSDGYNFIATTPIEQQRLNLGFTDLHTRYPFVVRAYDSEEELLRAKRLAYEADLAIFGCGNEELIVDRVLAGKFTFFYSERLYKKGLWQVFSPRGVLYDLHWRRIERRKPVYLLCASGFTARDYALHGRFWGKAYKWGYYPPVTQKTFDELTIEKMGNPSPLILWTGRLIDWKHPESVTALAATLKQKKKQFHISVIGTGEMEEQLRAEICHSQLDDCVSILGAKPPECVREWMERADIFIGTSDQNEGWGAVVNEAMNSGCAVVVSCKTGAAPYLIQNGENGLIFQSRDWQDLTKKVSILLDAPEKRVTLGRKAYETIMNIWNASVAADRVIALYARLNSSDERKLVFEDGPCSPHRWGSFRH